MKKWIKRGLRFSAGIIAAALILSFVCQRVIVLAEPVTEEDEAAEGLGAEEEEPESGEGSGEDSSKNGEEKGVPTAGAKEDKNLEDKDTEKENAEENDGSSGVNADIPPEKSDHPFDVSGTTESGLEIEVMMPAGVFPENTVLKVSDADDVEEELLEAAKATLPMAFEVQAFSIDFCDKDGKQVVPDGTFSPRIRLPEKRTAAVYWMMYLPEDDEEEPVFLHPFEEDGYLSFEGEKPGTYALVLLSRVLDASVVTADGPGESATVKESDAAFVDAIIQRHAEFYGAETLGNMIRFDYYDDKGGYSTFHIDPDAVDMPKLFLDGTRYALCYHYTDFIDGYYEDYSVQPALIQEDGTLDAVHFKFYSPFVILLTTYTSEDDMERDHMLYGSGADIYYPGVVNNANPMYYVMFEDWNGFVLSVQWVDEGKDAVPPDEPARKGYTFKNWDGEWKNVTENRTVRAVYEGDPEDKKESEPEEEKKAEETPVPEKAAEEKPPETKPQTVQAKDPDKVKQDSSSKPVVSQSKQDGNNHPSANKPKQETAKTYNTPKVEIRQRDRPKNYGQTEKRRIIADAGGQFRQSEPGSLLTETTISNAIETVPRPQASSSIRVHKFQNPRSPETGDTGLEGFLIGALLIGEQVIFLLLLREICRMENYDEEDEEEQH